MKRAGRKAGPDPSIELQPPMDTSCDSPPPARYELRFRSLANPGQALRFPCDASGRIDLDAMSEGVRLRYFYARTVIGREFAIPAVEFSAG